MTLTVRLLTFAVVLSVVACTTRAPVLPEMMPQVTEAIELSDTPFFPQVEYQCGPAALATVLKAAGVAVAPSDLTDQVFLPSRRGSLQVELLAATRRADRIPYLIEPTLNAIRAELDAGRPVLVLQNLGLSFLPVWHYAVVVGIDPANDSIILRSGKERRKNSRVTEFLQSWQMASNWGMVSLTPGEMPALTTPLRLITAVAQAEPMLSVPSRKRAYRAALDRWPDDITARFGYAHALYAAGELAAAEDNYRAIVNQYPRHAAALNNLAEVVADRGCYTQANAIARRALTIATKDQPALVGAIGETLHGFPTSLDDEHRCTQVEGASPGD